MTENSILNFLSFATRGSNFPSFFREANILAHKIYIVHKISASGDQVS